MTYSGSNDLATVGLYFDEWFSRVSFRNGTVPTCRNYGIGLRLAL